MSYPDDNPKTAIGATKAPLHLVPPSAIHYLASAFKDGAAKYGPYNWRDQKVSSSVYVGAALRHIGAWWDGANVSSDAGVEHLAHVMACCAIILDAASVGMLNDDRPTNGAAPRLQAEFAERKVSHQIDVDEAAEAAERDIDWNALFPTRAQLDAKREPMAALTDPAAESKKLGLYDDGIPAESAYLFKNGSRIDTPAEVDELRAVLTAEELKGFGIGDVAKVPHLSATTATSQHPAHAEALRMADERTPEDRL